MKTYIARYRNAVWSGIQEIDALVYAENEEAAREICCIEYSKSNRNYWEIEEIQPTNNTFIYISSYNEP